MPSWVKRTVFSLGGLFVFALVFVWLVLSSSILAPIRGDLTARLLTSKLGQEVHITGGVSVDLGPVLHVTVDGLVLPSQTMAEISLAKIGKLEFDVVLGDLLKGRVNLHDLLADSAQVALEVDQDGMTSWAGAGTKPSKSAGSAPANADADGTTKSAGKKDKDTSLAVLLAGHKIQFSNSGLTYKDARNGLDLDLLLTSLVLSQADKSAPVVLEGAGSMNGQELTLIGNFPANDPFKVTAAFSHISIEIDGTPDQGGYKAGYSTAISADIAKLGQLLDVLKLKKPVEGSGQVSAVIIQSGGSIRVEGLNVRFALDGGQSLEVTGDLGELGDPTDITIDTKIRLYSDANRPPPTTKRLDLKLIGIDMQLIAQPGGIPQRRMVIETNGFTLDTSGVGPPPISFREISRTPDGFLRIGKMVLRIGPPEANFLVLEGAVSDALGLDGIDVEGTLAFPIVSLLAPELLQTSDALGIIAGGFQLKGNATELSLSDLKAVSQGTDLWNLTVSGSVQNALNFSDVELIVAAEVPSGKALLGALDLDPVETGPVTLSTKVSSQGTEWATQATITVDDSHLNIIVDYDLDELTPTVRGKIGSDLIRTEHMREIGAAALQLTRLGKQEKEARQQNATAINALTSEDGKKTEPLVLRKPGQAVPMASGAAGGSVSESTGEPQPSNPFRNVTLVPLGRAILLSGMDLGVTIDLRKIEGKRGTSSLKTDLELKGHKARFGPVTFEYDDLNFDIGGSMDLIEDPDVLKLSGSTGGWNFGKILRDLKFKKNASGLLYAEFDLSGDPSSVREFLTTMNGSATVSMRNGSIDAQLLDLAGLGIIPWLFSKDRGPTVPIVCARAPLHFSDGRISSERTVVETDQVQIVVYGDVDLKRKTMSVAGQPRRIGKPLSRSPWPFTAVGPISKPKIKVKNGPRRLRRSDGASTMPQRRRPCVPDILQLK